MSNNQEQVQNNNSNFQAMIKKEIVTDNKQKK